MAVLYIVVLHIHKMYDFSLSADWLLYDKINDV